jgi:hypothetical protein
MPQSLSEAANTLGEYVVSQVISYILIEALFLTTCYSDASRFLITANKIYCLLSHVFLEGIFAYQSVLTCVMFALT